MLDPHSKQDTVVKPCIFAIVYIFFWCTSGKLDVQGNFRGSLVQPRHPLDGSLMSAGHPKQFLCESFWKLPYKLVW